MRTTANAGSMYERQCPTEDQFEQWTVEGKAQKALECFNL